MTTHTTEMFDCLSRLVAIPSVSSTDPAFDMSNRAVVDCLANWFEDAGFQIEIMSVPSAPGSDCEKVNLIARLGEGEDGLVIAGHTDTVPYNEQVWSTDPFVLTQREDKLYGLGSSDMKCLFPIALLAARAMKGMKLSQPLTILATADEESSMAGARVLQESGIRPGRHALIGEPTGMVPVIKHKGIMVERIELLGQSGHSSDPSLGRNALEGMNTVMNHLLAWRKELQEKHQDREFRVPVPTMNLGAIHGGDNPNRICASCELSMDIRLLPNMSNEEIKTELHNRVREAIAGLDLDVEFHGKFSGLNAMQTDADAEIVKLAENLSGHTATTVAFGTEGPFFNAMGMQTIILGPGDIEVAHQADEFVSLNRMISMQGILEKMINHFCVQT